MSEAHLALMTKLEELDAYTHTVLHQFPKLERHLLCAEMRTAIIRLAARYGHLVFFLSNRKHQLAMAFSVFEFIIKTAHQLLDGGLVFWRNSHGVFLSVFMVGFSISDKVRQMPQQLAPPQRRFRST